MTTRLDLKVSPEAARIAVTGWIGERPKVSVTAAPERGKANEAVEPLLAEALGLPGSALTVMAGHSSKLERIEIAGLTAEALRQRLPQ